MMYELIANLPALAEVVEREARHLQFTQPTGAAMLRNVAFELRSIAAALAAQGEPAPAPVDEPQCAWCYHGVKHAYCPVPKAAASPLPVAEGLDVEKLLAKNAAAQWAQARRLTPEYLLRSESEREHRRALERSVEQAILAALRAVADGRR